MLKNPNPTFLEIFNDAFIVVTRNLPQPSSEQFHENFNAERLAAIQALSSITIPSRKEDAWKYTDFSGFSFADYQIPSEKTKTLTNQELNPLALSEEIGQLQWIYNNGFLIKKPNPSPFVLENGVAVPGFKVNPPSERFELLNRALSYIGPHLTVVKNQQIKTPIIWIHGLHADQNLSMIHPRSRLTLEENSTAILIEINLSSNTGSGFLNSGTDLVLKAGSTLKHLKLHYNLAEILHISSLHVAQASNSQYTGSHIVLGGNTNRSNITIELQEPQAKCEFYILSLLSQHERSDVSLEVKHLSPHCSSDIISRSVVNKQARSAFTGKIYVAEGATQTKASLQDKSLLLSAEAEANTRPQLEIYNDDVQCSHGATVGHLDQEALFYLKSRGIGEDLAKELLIQSFIAPTLAGIPECVTESLKPLIRSR